MEGSSEDDLEEEEKKKTVAPGTAGSLASCYKRLVKKITGE